MREKWILGDLWSTFSVCQSLLKRYYWHCLVQYLWARCERSEQYLALRDFPTPPGLQIEVNLYSCHLHLSPPPLLLFPALWTLPAREFLLKPHSATQVGQSALAAGSKSFILWLGGVRKVITLLRESSGAVLCGPGSAVCPAPASPTGDRGGLLSRSAAFLFSKL